MTTQNESNHHSQKREYLMRQTRGRHALWVPFCIIGITVALAGCGRKHAETVSLGVLAPLTGEGATYGEAMKKGLDLAVEQCGENAQGNRRIKLVYEDTKLSPRETLNCLRQLIEIHKTPLIFGPASSSCALQAVPVARESRVPLFSSIATADALDDAGEFFFRNIPKNHKQIETIADYIVNTLKAKRVAVLYENNDYGVNMQTEIGNVIKDRIVLSEAYDSGQRDFRDVLAKVKQATADVVFVPGTYNEVSLIIRQARELGIQSTLISGDGAYSPTLLKNAGEKAEGFCCTLVSVSDKDAPQYRKFATAYVTKYGAEPDVYSVLSYDAGVMVMGIINSAPDGVVLDGNYIKEKLRTTEHVGAFGVTKFNEHGGIDRLYEIYTVKNGKFEILRRN